MKKGSNAVHSQLSELKAKGPLRQKAEGLYVAFATPGDCNIGASEEDAKETQAIARGPRVHQESAQARWAAVKKAKS